MFIDTFKTLWQTDTKYANCASQIIRDYPWENQEICPVECDGFRAEFEIELFSRLSRRRLRLESSFKLLKGFIEHRWRFRNEVKEKMLIFVQYKSAERTYFPTGTVKYSMAEVMFVVLTETETYPLAAFISDTGGAAGLFLGLHVLGILPTVRKLIKAVKFTLKKRIRMEMI